MANYTNHRRQSDLPVRCDTCHYRYGTGKHSMCQYILLAGVSRDCPEDENCTKYINKKCKKEKDKMASRITWTPELDAEVDQLRAEGWEWDKIGERIGCSGKAAGIRYYKRHKPIHTPAKAAAEDRPAETAREAVKEAGLPYSDKPYDPDDTPDPYVYDGGMTPEDYEAMHKSMEAAQTAAKPAEYDVFARGELFGILNDLTQQADYIATITGLLQLVHSDAEGGAKHYNALMDRLDILLELLTESTEALDQVAERLDTAIKNQPQSSNSEG